MRVHATDEQLKKMAALAVNASEPMGMGILHFQARQYKPEEFNVSRGIDLDYHQGRMVKLYIRRYENTELIDLPETAPRIDYQSWASAYPTYAALAKAAGIEVGATAKAA